MCVGGEVGDGIFGEEYEGEGAPWPPPFMAARWDEDKTARSAALAGSSVVSAIVLSCVGCVGDAFLGVVPMRILRVEYWRLTDPMDERGGGVGAGGDITGSYE